MIAILRAFCIAFISLVCMFAANAFKFSSGARVFRNSLQVQMSNQAIKVVRDLPASDIERLRIKSWPTWGCEKSKFDWYYGETETSYILKGSVIVTPTNPQDGSAVTIEKGDYCTFPAGLSCTWEVTEDILKHYNFSHKHLLLSNR